MQIVRRKQPAVAMQVSDGGLKRLVTRDHACVQWHQVALAQVAWRTCGDNIFPCGCSALGAGNHMIEGEIVAGAAILAGKTVAEKNIEAGKGRLPRRLDIGLE